MNAIIISVGDELMMGQTIDTNSAWLSTRLVALGCTPLYHKTVGDDLGGIVDAVLEAGDRADIVVITGGLGPTEDDMTRHALAKTINVPLDLHEPSLETIEKFFRSIGRVMPPTNRIQAMYPRGSDVLANYWGTAPGIHLVIGAAHLYAFPGVPREMRGMFERYIVPYLEQMSGRSIVTESITTFGAGESTVAEALGPLMERTRNPLVGTTVSGGEVTIRVRSDFVTREEAMQACEDVVLDIKKRMGDWVVGVGGSSLTETTVNMARSLGVLLTVAESCTGGLLAKLLTDIPGSSDVFLGGWVTYSNELKVNELGVSPDVLSKDGAVSQGVAMAMAEGALKRSGADYALALTGVAGPAGGTESKPVGTVWLAIASRQGSETRLESECYSFPGERGMIRLRAAKTAINRLRLALLARRTS